MNKNYQLPEAVETHFLATNEGNPTAFISTFHDAAVVFDAGKEYHGKAAIKEWSDKTYFEEHLRLEITNVVQDAKEFIVTGIASGNFDKTGLPDPLCLDFHFILKGTKVSFLRIVLASNDKAVPLPQPIATYYHACDGYDKDLLMRCFTDAAVLYDEGKEYYGPAAICEHIMKANQDAKVTKEIIRCTEQNDRSFVVTAMLTGEFEGSPLPLDYHFTLDEERIKALKITPEE